jgi:hypothetical protein
LPLSRRVLFSPDFAPLFLRLLLLLLLLLLLQPVLRQGPPRLRRGRRQPPGHRLSAPPMGLQGVFPVDSGAAAAAPPLRGAGQETVGLEVGGHLQGWFEGGLIPHALPPSARSCSGRPFCIQYSPLSQAGPSLPPHRPTHGSVPLLTSPHLWASSPPISARQRVPWRGDRPKGGPDCLWEGA